MIEFIVFISGLIVGSFLNAVIYRLHTGQSIWLDRSECPHCHHKLAALDLVPVFSFIFLRGRCRYCRKKISWQYPIVELTTALSFVLLFLNSRFQILVSRFLFDLIFICFFIVIGVFDFKHFLILDKVVYPAFILAIVFRILTGGLIDGFAGMVLISGFFALQYYLSKGRWIGFGDVKLGLFLGMLFGIRQGIVMLMLAYFIGALAGLTLIAMGRKQLGSRLAFGTFLALSAIIILIWGYGISGWYFRLLGL